VADLIVLVLIFSVIALVHLVITWWSVNSGTDLDPYFMPPRIF
jgi:hypothetical protein